MRSNSKNVRDGVIIAILILIITLFHYRTDISFPYFHDIYKILYYIPIILSAFRFGVRGGVLVAVGVTIIYTPHVMQDWADHPMMITNRFAEMVMYIAVAFLTGKLVENERKERRRYEQAATELSRAYEQLQQRTENLAEVEEQLRAAERLATLGELTASLAHEVRNPLAAIKGTAEILRDDYPLNGKNQDFFDLLINDVDRIEKVIDNYLGQVRVSSSQNTIFDAGSAARTVAQILQAKVRKESKRLDLQMPESAMPVRGDEVKFKQVLINLLLNAFAAVEAGGKIEFALRIQEDQQVNVVIRDDGRGIAPEEMQKIFKPFYTTRKDGTGLGLSIARRIAEEYGWHLDLESTPGEGTTARLTIALTKAV